LIGDKVHIVLQLEADEHLQVRKIVKRLEGAVVEGQILDVGTALNEFFDGGRNTIDFNAVKAKLIDFGRLSTGLDSFSNLGFGSFGHPPWNIKEFNSIIQTHHRNQE
jgi:hypothetical protein